MFRSTAPRLASLILTLALAAPLTGCMLTRPDSGPAFRYVQDNMIPENRTAQYALLPVFIPVGAAAALTDAAIIHPVSIIADTADDTGDALWKRMDWDGQYMTEAAVLPWRAVLTPVFFAGMWTGRVLFEIPNEAERLRAANSPEEEERAKLEADIMAKAERLIEIGEAENALKLLIANQNVNWSNPAGQQSDYVLLIFRAALDCGRYEIFEEFALGPYYQATQTKEFAALLEEMAASDNPYARGVALGAQADNATRMRGEQDAREILLTMLKDDSDAVRALGLLRFRPWTWSRKSLGPELLGALESIKTDDASEWNREKAAAIMRQLLEAKETEGKTVKPTPPLAE